MPKRKPKGTVVTLPRSQFHSGFYLKTATLIYNPVAGRRPAARANEMRQAAAVLLRAGIEVKLAPTSGPGMATDLAREAARKPSSLVLACGGDGTINEVINGMIPGRTPLGILPGGTANIAAKELGLPHNPIQAARALPGWKEQRIALGRASFQATPEHAKAESLGTPPVERYFLSVAGVGFDAYVVYRLRFDFKLSLGVVAYAIEAIRQALRHSFPAVICRFDAPSSAEVPQLGKQPDSRRKNNQELRGTLAVIQRTERYAGWLHLAPSANLFRPKLILCLFTSRSRWRYFAYIGAVVARLHHRLKDVKLLDAERIHCTAAAPERIIHFQVDGELAGVLPATFEIVPDALTLLVPTQAGLLTGI